MTRSSPEAPRSSRPFLAGLAVFWLLIVGALGLKLSGQTFDDAFITYRYADNLAAGRGLVWQEGLRSLGSTAPGLALGLGLAHRLTSIPIPVLGTITTAFAIWVLALLAARELAVVSRLGAAITGTLIVSTVFFWTHNGSEFVPLLALLAVAAVVPGAATSGICAGLAVCLRGDALVAVPCVALARWMATEPDQRRQPRPWVQWAGAAGGVVAGAAALSWFYYGAALPSTLRAKQAQAALDLPFWKSGLEYWSEGTHWLRVGVFGNTLGWIVLVALLGVAVMAVPSRTRQLPLTLALTAFAALHAAAYPVLQVPLYTWYLIPTIFALILLLGVAGSWLEHFVRSRSKNERWRIVVPLIVWILAAPLWWPPMNRTFQGYRAFQNIGRYVDYRALADWLREDAETDDAFYFTEVGIIGFFSQIQVADPLGLVSPEALPYLERGDLSGYFEEARPRYVIEHPDHLGLMRLVFESRTFRDGYEKAVALPLIDGRAVTIHKRRTPGPAEQRSLP